MALSLEKVDGLGGQLLNLRMDVYNKIALELADSGHVFQSGGAIPAMTRAVRLAIDGIGPPIYGQIREALDI